MASFVSLEGVNGKVFSELSIPVFDFLFYASEACRIFGYKKREGNSYSTGDIACAMYGAFAGYSFVDEPFFVMNSVNISEEVLSAMDSVDIYDLENSENQISIKNVKDFFTEVANPYSEENMEKVLKAIDWAFENASNSQYLNNFKEAFEKGEVSPDSESLNLLASIIPSYERAMNNSNNTSEFVGEVKQRLTIAVNSARVVTTYESPYGLKYLYEFKDSKGNVFTWWSTVEIEEIEQVKLVTGTVKNHTVFQGVKQTDLTRCKVA